MSVNSITIERIERVIAVTAQCMARHNLPQLLPTLKRLEAERDKLLTDGDPIEYAGLAATQIPSSRFLKSLPACINGHTCAFGQRRRRPR